MILLNYVVEIFDLQHFDQPEPSIQIQQTIHVLYPGEIVADFVYHNSVGNAVVADYAGEESGRRCFIPVLLEHEIKGFSKLVDSAVIVRPLAFDLDIGFISHSAGHCTAMSREGIR